MGIRIREGIPEAEDLWHLFLTTGWNAKYSLSRDELISAFSASWCVLGAYEADRLLGIGRVVSDTIVHAMIYDLIVLPERQGCGIGARLLAALVRRCQQARIRDIQLFCANGKRSFYEKRGFVARPDQAPGMEYTHAETPGSQRSCG